MIIVVKINMYLLSNGRPVLTSRCNSLNNAEDRFLEETTPHVPATGSRALQKIREENRTAFDLNEVVSVDPMSAPRTSLDPAVTVEKPRTRKRSVSSVPSSAAVTDGRVRSGEAQKKTNVARLSTLKSVPRVGSILWVDPNDLRWTTMRSSASSLVDVVWRMS